MKIIGTVFVLIALFSETLSLSSKKAAEANKGARIVALGAASNTELGSEISSRVPVIRTMSIKNIEGKKLGQFGSSAAAATATATATATAAVKRTPGSGTGASSLVVHNRAINSANSTVSQGSATFSFVMVVLVAILFKFL